MSAANHPHRPSAATPAGHPAVAADATVIVSAADEPLCPAPSARPDLPVPRPEHPRPDFERTGWINLNGTWEFEFDPANMGEYHGWYRPDFRPLDKRILVPFCWESGLSGLSATEYRGAAWYRRVIAVPAEWRQGGRRVLLRFGAVDWHARVWLNGRQLGEHEGGYTPFEFDITDHLRHDGGPDVLTVRAFDVTAPDCPSGKQTGWYTRCSGIWQTVWLESVGPAYLTKVHLAPDVDAAAVDVTVAVTNKGKAGRAVLEIEPEDGDGPRLCKRIDLPKGHGEFRLRANVRNPRLWSPETPHLYHLRVRIRPDDESADAAASDTVRTYFGMRKVHRGLVGDRQREVILLNNRPVFLIGALDQSYNPDGIYTYPNEGYLLHDLHKAKEFGFNFLRVHIKIDEPRLLYHADRLGILLMCDVPNFAHFSRTARDFWQATFDEALERDFNHPSIFSWCLFNETWGLQPMQEPQAEFVERMYRHAKAADPTRLIEDHSPCNYDHVVTDINSWHFYINDPDRAREHVRNFMARAHEGSGFNYVEGHTQNHEPVINSEYGGVDAGMGDMDVSWSFKFLTNELRLQPELCGYVYTELQDIEWEHNGFLRYDRSGKRFGYADNVPGFRPRDINSPDFVALDCHPCPRVEPGARWETDVFLSHWSGRDIGAERGDCTLHWSLTGTDAAGRRREFGGAGRAIRFRPYHVDRVARISVDAPDEPLVGVVSVWVTDRTGAVVCRNYVNLDVYAGPPPVREVADPHTCLLRWNPCDFVAEAWSGGETTLHRDKVAGLGAGRFEYRLALPDGLDPADIEAGELVFEGAARAGGEKVDARFRTYPWVRRKPSDYPQTDEIKYPTDLTVRINGAVAASVTLPDDPADAAGVLSHVHGLDAGSYGYLIRVPIRGHALEELRRSGGPGREGSVSVTFEVSPDARHRGGFSLYGDRTGRYPLDPTLALRTGRPLDERVRDLGPAAAAAAAVITGELTPVEAASAAAGS